jgi:NAD(P)-dependent dehydrogenase (short-subunit alcohol dehydrogenase family)
VGKFLVVGSEGNLGKVLCSSLIEKNHGVVGLDIKNISESSVHKNYEYVSVDVTDYIELQAIARSVANSGEELSGLVNCTYHPELFDHTESKLSGDRITKLDLAFRQYTQDSFSKELVGNLIPVHNIIRAFLPNNLKTPFSVVNISSVLGVRQPNPVHLDFPDRFRFKPPGYSVSKAAIIAYTEYCANLYAGSNFRFNTVAPGFVDHGQDSKFISRFDERLSIQRFAKLDEVVRPIEFLLSDEASYITGTTLIVDGGYASR